MKPSLVVPISKRQISSAVILAITLGLLVGCTSTRYPPLSKATPSAPSTSHPEAYNYLIGPGDSINAFVWRNPEVSMVVKVRPDGKITTPLVEDLQASGKTPSQLARDIEKALATYIKDPIVTVIVGDFVGPFSEQVRVVGEAARPQALFYRHKMTALDVMIAVGGLTAFADGNRASIVRTVEGQQQQYEVRLRDLVKDGDIGANVDMLPGDILIIPESWF